MPNVTSFIDTTAFLLPLSRDPVQGLTLTGFFKDTGMLCLSERKVCKKCIRHSRNFQLYLIKRNMMHSFSVVFLLALENKEF